VAEASETWEALKKRQPKATAVESIWGRTAKLSMIHPAPNADRIETTRITALWILFRVFEVGAARASLGAMLNVHAMSSGVPGRCGAEGLSSHSLAGAGRWVVSRHGSVRASLRRRPYCVL